MITPCKQPAGTSSAWFSMKPASLEPRTTAAKNTISRLLAVDPLVCKTQVSIVGSAALTLSSPRASAGIGHVWDSRAHWLLTRSGEIMEHFQA